MITGEIQRCCNGGCSEDGIWNICCAHLPMLVQAPSTDMWSQHPQSDSRGPLAALWYLRYRGTDRLGAVSAYISKYHAHLHSRACSSGHCNPWHVLQRAARGPQAVELRECWPEGTPHVRNAVRLVHGHQAEVARCMQLLQLCICAGCEVLWSGVDVLKLP